MERPVRYVGRDCDGGNLWLSGKYLIRCSDSMEFSVAKTLLREPAVCDTYGGWIHRIDSFDDLNVYSVFNGSDRERTSHPNTFLSPDDPVVGACMYDDRNWFALHRSGTFYVFPGEKSIIRPVPEFKRKQVMCIYNRKYDSLYIFDGNEIRVIHHATKETIGDIDDVWDRADQTIDLFWNDDASKDLTLHTAGGKSLRVHSNILNSIEGSVFQAERRFYEHANEGTIIRRESFFFEKMDVEYEIVELVMRYCYFGRLDMNMGTEKVIRLIVVADACCMPGLVSYLSMTIQERMHKLKPTELVVLYELTSLFRSTITAKLMNLGGDYLHILQGM